MLRSRVQTTEEQYRKVLLDQGLEVEFCLDDMEVVSPAAWSTWIRYLGKY